MEARTIDWRGGVTCSGRVFYQIFLPAGLGLRAYEGPVVAEALETAMGTGFYLIMNDQAVPGEFFKRNVQPCEICNRVLDILTA